MSVFPSHLLLLVKTKGNGHAINDADISSSMRSRDIKLSTLCAGSVGKSQRLCLSENYLSIHKPHSVRKHGSTQSNVIKKNLEYKRKFLNRTSSQVKMKTRQTSTRDEDLKKSEDRN